MALFALIASAALAQAVEAATESSTTPYATLYEVLSPVAKINQYDHLIAIERIESKLPGVRPETIKLVIHAKQGSITLPIKPNGEVDFPVTDALRAENPPVETNQPKGSLALIVNVALRLPAGTRVAWRDIEAGLAQVKTFYAQTQGATAPSIEGVEAYFTPDKPAMLTIEGKNERLLMADPAGRIMVMRATATENGDSTLVFSRAPEFVLPYTDDKK